MPILLDYHCFSPTPITTLSLPPPMPYFVLPSPLLYLFPYFSSVPHPQWQWSQCPETPIAELFRKGQRVKDKKKGEETWEKKEANNSTRVCRLCRDLVATNRAALLGLHEQAVVAIAVEGILASPFQRRLRYPDSWKIVRMRKQWHSSPLGERLGPRYKAKH